MSGAPNRKEAVFLLMARSRSDSVSMDLRPIPSHYSIPRLYHACPVGLPRSLSQETWASAEECLTPEKRVSHRPHCPSHC